MAVSAPWEAERVVDAGLARALVTERFFAPRQVEPFGEGWDNTVFLADGWVFRFPRRQIAVPLLKNEARLLPALAPRLPLPVPVPRLFPATPGPGAERFPWPFAGHLLLPGHTTDAATPTDDERARAAPILGAFLRTLHAQPDEAPPDQLARTDADKLRRLLRERLPQLGLTPPAWIDRPLRPPPLTTLVHGDLHARQILFDAPASSPRGVCGVIDWGDAHRGHPAVDLSIAWSFLPPPSRGAFREAYGPIDEETWLLARLRAVHLCAALGLYAKATFDSALHREALAGIDRASTQETSA
jgi:aminoglycoside phosphotransferase (APT) family kinase protein